LRCGVETRSFGALEQRSNQFANALIGYGLAENERLAILCRNSIASVETALGAEKAGMRATVINPMAGRRDMEAALKCCNPHAIVTNVRSVLDVASSMPDTAVRIFAGRVPGFDDYETILGNASCGPVTVKSRGIAMPLTSGTTGLPKAVFRTQAYVPPYLRRLLAVTAFDGSCDVAMAPCGLQGSGVYNLAVGLPLKAGVGVIIADVDVTTDIDPEEVLRTIERERVTHLYLPNYIMRRLLAFTERTRNRYDRSSLRCVLHTGSPCPIPMKSALIEWLGPIVTEIYAGSEGGGTLITSDEWLSHKGSAGKPAEGLVKIFAPGLEEAATGSEGKIYFHAPRHQRFEYFNNPAATLEAYQGDDFTLGDIGHLDRDGYLYVTGRVAEVIDFSGYNVLPAEIDAVLLEHPAVEACAAIGVPDDVLGEIVGAVIVVRDGYHATSALTEELSRWCRARLAASKCPRSLVYCNEIPGFTQGKVNRKALRVLFAGQGMDGVAG
jgi:long-chain acyl-CoA synthetase